MKKVLKTGLKRLLRRFGYSISKRHFLSDPFLQLERLVELRSIVDVIDVGANEGQFATRFLKIPAFNGQIISFEPEEAAHQNLVKNADKVAHWRVGDRVAIGDETGEIELNVSDNSVSSSVLKVNDIHVESAPKSKIVGTQKVRIARLDDEIGVFGSSMRNIYLKVDVQGFELEVLRGANALLKKTLVVQLEVSLVSLYDDQAEWTEIHQYMKGNNFLLWGIQNGFHDKNTGQQLQVDLIYVRNE